MRGSFKGALWTHQDQDTDRMFPRWTPKKLHRFASDYAPLHVPLSHKYFHHRKSVALTVAARVVYDPKIHTRRPTSSQVHRSMIRAASMGHQTRGYVALLVSHSSDAHLVSDFRHIPGSSRLH